MCCSIKINADEIEPERKSGAGDRKHVEIAYISCRVS
jgi:hypothetical protein